MVAGGGLRDAFAAVGPLPFFFAFVFVFVFVVGSALRRNFFRGGVAASFASGDGEPWDELWSVSDARGVSRLRLMFSLVLTGTCMPRPVRAETRGSTVKDPDPIERFPGGNSFSSATGCSAAGCASVPRRSIIFPSSVGSVPACVSTSDCGGCDISLFGGAVHVGVHSREGYAWKSSKVSVLPSVGSGSNGSISWSISRRRTSCTES